MFQKNLKKWSEEHKLNLINTTLKLKKYPNGLQLQKKQTCPYHKCMKQFGSVQNLKQHLDKKHPRLAESGLQLNAQGVFEWNQGILDFCLSLAKIYPKFVKKVINESKKSNKS